MVTFDRLIPESATYPGQATSLARFPMLLRGGLMARRLAGAWLLVLALVGFARGQATTTTTTTSSQQAGVVIDAEGVLKVRLVTDRGGLLARRRVEEALSRLPLDIARTSKLRKISLNRLEAALKDRLEAGDTATDEMLHLAGMTRVSHVFFYPDSHDIVIAGPAEAWAEDPAGRTRGVESGRPTILLSDLVVALRAFPPQGTPTPLVSCSIDPTKEGLANMQEFLKTLPNRLGGQPTASTARFIADGLQRSLGLQVVTIQGIPDNTHFAQVLVEADYRMKLIGIGLEKPPVKLKSYVDLANPSSVAANAMQRWYFTPNYSCVRATEDGWAMELEGEGVKLIGADELVAADGTRVAAGREDAAGKLLVQGFTDKYPELARTVPIYAQLRNCIDLLVAAAFIQKEDYYGQAGWTMPVLSSEDAFAVQTAPAAKRVDSAVATVLKGNRLMTPIGGGVNIQARRALSPEHLLTDDEGKVAAARAAVSVSGLTPSQWWWD